MADPPAGEVAGSDDELDALRPSPPVPLRERVALVLDAVGTTPRRAATGLLLALAAVALAAWVLRPAAPPVEAGLPLATIPPAPVTETSAATVIVHVAGAVRRPGVHELPAGSRVVDALEAAGGAGRDADLARLNLAAELVDGERIYVPRVGEEPPPSMGGDTGAGDQTRPVDLNTASLEQLDALPGIGPTTAQAILDWRADNGPFTSVDQLLDVRGIGEAKLAELRDLVTA